jgi:hypothetical protein
MLVNSLNGTGVQSVSIIGGTGRESEKDAKDKSDHMNLKSFWIYLRILWIIR